ncbi:MAG: addiction module protein [Myxococcota bacterium]
MTSAARQLLQAALELPEQEREALAVALLESTGGEDPLDVEHAWRDEIKQRVDALEGGEVTPVPWSEARQRIFAR